MTITTGTVTVAPVPTRTPAGFDVAVDPGAAYRFTISAPDGYVPLTIPATAQDPDIGASISLTAAMVERTITGTVSGASTGISVQASNGTTTITGTVNGSSYTISKVSNGTWTVEAAAFGSGRGTSTAQTVGTATGNITGVGVTLNARQWTINFTTTPDNTAVAITGGASGTASGGSLALNHPETAATAAWTATADGYITKTGSVDRPAAPSDPFWTTLSTTATITLVRPVATATVTKDGAAVGDATVTLCPGATGACDGTTANAIAMTFANGVYSATPTSSGSWRIAAVKGTDTAGPTSFTVSSAGVISVSLPIPLAFPDTPPTPTT